MNEVGWRVTDEVMREGKQLEMWWGRMLVLEVLIYSSFVSYRCMLFYFKLFVARRQLLDVIYSLIVYHCCIRVVER